MKKLYKFYWDCGRAGFLDGLFIAEEEHVKLAIGKTIYFGEVLGKHSDIYDVFKEEGIREVLVKPETISDLEVTLGKLNISGYNPLNYQE
jgi:hypothetical protein